MSGLEDVLFGNVGGGWMLHSSFALFGAADPSVPSAWTTFLQHCLTGLTNGSLIALIALGYTMVYGIIELINFAHGDLFMLGSCLALSLIGVFGLNGEHVSPVTVVGGILLIIVIVSAFCALLNAAVDRVVYLPLRKAPKLAPLVSAIGVSYIFMNAGLLWIDAADRDFPNLIADKVSDRNLFAPAPQSGNGGEQKGSATVSANGATQSQGLRFTVKDLMVIVITVPIMVGLTLLVKYTKLGKAMRATAQNPTAAQLMGINVDRVITSTFLIGGALAGVASVTYSLYINTIGYQMGFTNGLYAFTAAVLGGIGNLPGAVLGGLIIGLVRSLGSGYVSEVWTSALIFGILIVILIFRPSGLLGARVKEKV